MESAAGIQGRRYIQPRSRKPPPAVRPLGLYRECQHRNEGLAKTLRVVMNRDDRSTRYLHRAYAGADATQARFSACIERNIPFTTCWLAWQLDR